MAVSETKVNIQPINQPSTNSFIDKSMLGLINSFYVSHIIQVVALVRLCEGRNIGDITEVPIPTRFLFILLGPPGSQGKNVEIGRSMSTIMVDEVGTHFTFLNLNFCHSLSHFCSCLSVMSPSFSHQSQ